MDKKKLRQYRSLKREQKMLEDKWRNWNREQKMDPAVIGKVKGSMDTFPYIETAHENYNGRAQAGRYDRLTNED